MKGKTNRNYSKTVKYYLCECFGFMSTSRYPQRKAQINRNNTCNKILTI